MRHRVAVVVGVAVAVLVGVLLLTSRGDAGTPIWTGVCTNSAGATHTWTADSGSPGFVGPGSASVSAAAPAWSTTPPDPKAPALAAIADGVDPVDAARLFGAVFLPGDITAAQRAAAQDPATYGWHCAH